MGRPRESMEPGMDSPIGYHPMSDLGRCTGDGCGRPIRWVTTEGGRNMPLDPDPHPDGTVIAHTRPDGTIVARVLSGDQLPAQQQAWRAHWSTCPASPQFRKRQARTLPKCRVCGMAMDPTLARTERWTTHPSCDPAGHRPARQETAGTQATIDEGGGT